MSVYKDPRSPHYQYDFRLKGRRFYGSTGATSRREAQAFEQRRRDQAAKEIADGAAAAAELKGAVPLTLDVATGQWWIERGQHRADADDCWTAIEGMIEHFGATRRLDAISDADIAAWVATWRGRRVWGKTKFLDGREAPLLSNGQVNRMTVDKLRTIYGHARRAWKLRYASEPDWRAHRLPEAEERVRELEAGEQSALDAAARAGYDHVYRFARLSGLRLAACLLRKSDVLWSAGRIEVRSKGGKLNRVPLSAEIRALLLECWPHDDTWVFTYVALRTRGGRIKGQRYPVTLSGLKTQWKRDRRAAAKAAGSLSTLRFHDLRHTAATRLLRSSGNLKMAQRLLNHSRISTTAKYAHVLDDELLEAMDAIQDRDAGSRKKSRTGTGDK